MSVPPHNAANQRLLLNEPPPPTNPDRRRINRLDKFLYRIILIYKSVFIISCRMQPNLEIDLLHSFVAVSETLSFTRAAARVSRTQSAISGHIKRLEETLGTRLFHRTKRSVRLTAEGETFRRYAEAMLRLNSETLAVFGRPSLNGRIRLGATDTSMCFLPPVLRRFAESHPLVELEIRCDRSWEALDALEAGGLDLALVTQPCGRDGGETVRREPLIWAAARNSAAERVEPLPLALFGPGCVYRAAALHALDETGRSWRHAYESVSRDGLMVAVLAGLAVTIVPKSALPADMRMLGAEDGLPPLPDMEVMLYRSSAPAPRAGPAMAQVIREVLSAPAPAG
jgi:DNA-binding transcriptional LysR family regulator